MARNLMLRWAKAPFYFNSAAHLTRIGNQRATTLGEFAQALESALAQAALLETILDDRLGDGGGRQIESLAQLLL